MARPSPDQPGSSSNNNGTRPSNMTGPKKGKRNAASPKGIKRKSHRKKQEANKHAPAGSRRAPAAVPSKASGGVPEPTLEYSQQASLAPSRLPVPRTLLVVLDLNGTLLHRPKRSQSHKFVERPYAKRLMQYCIDTFKVVVWSSARPENVAIMCRQLLGDSKVAGDDAAALGDAPWQDQQHQQHQSHPYGTAAAGPAAAPSIHDGMESAEATRLYRDRLVAVWGRDKFGLSPKDYVTRVQCYKRLQAVWANPEVRASHPDFAGDAGVALWDQSNTVLVDDSAEKARTQPCNLVRLPEFLGNAQETGDVLPQVHDYLNELAWQADVSRYIRESPFRLREDYSLERNGGGATGT